MAWHMVVLLERAQEVLAHQVKVVELLVRGPEESSIEGNLRELADAMYRCISSGDIDIRHDRGWRIAIGEEEVIGLFADIGVRDAIVLMVELRVGTIIRVMAIFNHLLQETPNELLQLLNGLLLYLLNLNLLDLFLHLSLVLQLAPVHYRIFAEALLELEVEVGVVLDRIGAAVEELVRGQQHEVDHSRGENERFQMRHYFMN
jgi:hypothetical protein